MMNNLLRKCCYLTVVALLFVASASFAQTTTQVTLTAPPGAGLDNAYLGGVYVDPYLATVGGQTNVPVICDDWSNNTYTNESWTATVTNMTSSGLPSGATTLFSAGSASLTSTLYNEAAWLATQLMSGTNPTTPSAQDEISFALWELTYPDNANQENPNPFLYMAEAEGYTSFSACLAANDSLCEGAQTYLTDAQMSSNYTGAGAGWTILTPNTGTSQPSGDGLPQEFLVQTSSVTNGLTSSPESSSAVVLGADMFGLLGLAFVFRRRLLRPTN